MEINFKLTILFLLPAAFMLLLVACGEGTKPLDDYAALLAPIEDERDKLYQRMNDEFDDTFTGLLTAFNSSSQAVQASAITEFQTFSEEMYNEWDTLLRRFVQITPPGELMEFHELYQEGFQLYHRAFFDSSTSLTIFAATGQMDNEMVTAISNDMMEADRKFTKASAEWAKVQARYK